jgi:hypothetical protein
VTFTAPTEPLEDDKTRTEAAASTALAPTADAAPVVTAQLQDANADEGEDASAEPAALEVDPITPADPEPYFTQDLPATATGTLGDLPSFASVVKARNVPEDAKVTWYYLAGNYSEDRQPTAISASNSGMTLTRSLINDEFTASWTQVRQGEYLAARWATWNGFRIYAVISWTAADGAEASLTSARTTWTALLHPPTIETQPADRAVDAGQTATFTVADTDGFGAAYRWQASADGQTWTDIPDADTATLSIANATVTQSGSLYRAVVTNNAGTVISDPAELTVRPSDVPPKVFTSPADASATALTALVRFTATAQSTTAHAQWQVKAPGGEWADIPGATSLTVTQDGVSSSYPLYIRDNDPKPADGTQYRAAFNNEAGTNHTEPATLTMWSAQVTIAEEAITRGGTVHLSAVGLPANKAVTISNPRFTWASAEGAPTTSASGTLDRVPLRVSVAYYGDNALPGDYGLVPLGRLEIPILVQGVGSTSLEFRSESVELVEDPDAVAPEILVAPVEKTFANGEAVSYSATIADNPGPVYYRWSSKINQSTPTEANSGLGTTDGNTHTITHPAITQAGAVYRFWVWTAAGIAVSDWVTVRRADPEAPAVTTQPSSQLAAPGDTVSFTAAGTGVTTPDVQWQKRAPLSDDYEDIPGAVQDTLVIEHVQEADNGTVYRAVYTNQLGSARSGAAMLSVTAASQSPKVTAHPQDLTVETGQAANFTAAASAAPAASAQWYSSRDGENWAIIAGAANTTLTVTSTPESLSGTLYKAVFTNSAGIAQTNPATLTVTPEPAERTYVSIADPTVTFTGPTRVEPGADITVSGTGWKDTPGTHGSVIAVKLDDGAVVANFDAVNPQTGEPQANRTIYAITAADADGNWSATIPYPTSANSDAKWRPGESHNIRLLTGSLLLGDKIRSEEIRFTINGDTQTGPDEPPVWAHETVTVTDPQTGQTATAWVQKQVEATPGAKIKVKGTGWINRAATGGSTIALKLNSGATSQHTRAGEGIVQHPSAVADDTIWALVAPSNPEGHANVHLIGADGTFEVELDAPSGLEPGDYLTVLFQSGRFDAADVTRAVTSGFLTVGGQTYVPPGGSEDQVACVPSTPSPLVAITNPQLALGQKLQVSGTGWCHPGENRGGSIIAIKLDEGAYSHMDDSLHQNRTIWAIIEVDPETGDWTAELDLPDGTTAGPFGSSPAFLAGAHTLRLLTGSLKAGDAVRTVQSEEFVLGEYAPNGVPDPLEYTEDLRDSAQGGVTITRQTTELLVTVPGAAEGDWVFLSAYVEDGSPRLPWQASWFQAGPAGRVTAPLAGVTLPVGKVKITAQSGNQGEVGRLLGWQWLTVAAPADPPAGAPDPIKTPPLTPVAQQPASGNGSGNTGAARTATYTTVSRAAAAAAPSTTAPTFVPDAPFADGNGLTTENTGGLSAVQEGTVVTITIPSAATGDWVYLYAFSEPTAVGWIQADSGLQVRIDVAGLEAGEHKIAVLDQESALIGWVGAHVDGAALEPAAQDEPAPSATPAPPASLSPEAAPAAGRGAWDWWLLGGAAGVAALLLTVALVVPRRGRVRAAHRSAR